MIRVPTPRTTRRNNSSRAYRRQETKQIEVRESIRAEVRGYFAAGRPAQKPGAPGAPTSVTATGGDTKATVSWSAPASDNGSAITQYDVTSSPGGLTANTSGTSVDVTGLTNGTAYTFTVTATNANGTGPASAASNSVTPAQTISTTPTELNSVALDVNAITVSSNSIGARWAKRLGFNDNTLR